jgi:2-dehydro-3-deoxyphosphogluconate aldolase / (4S)-4-hydroxy-2-oxoglutarate aldolase
VKQQNLDRLTKSGVVAVVRRMDRDKVMDVIASLVDGGITGIEITMDSMDAQNVIGEAKKRFGDQAVIGAGTVLNAETAECAIHAGAEFIFAPSLDKETILMAKKYGKIAIPGVFTPTEMVKGYEWGADIVKVFPADVLGSKFIKGVRAPLQHIPMIPTGGIHLDNVAEFIQAGSIAVGVGGALLKRDFIVNGQWNKLSQLAHEYVEAVSNARLNHVY